MTPIFELPLPPDAPRRAVIALDDAHLAIATAPRTVQVVDPVSGRTMRSVPMLAGGAVVLEDARGVSRLDRSGEETLAPAGSRVLWHDDRAEHFLVREGRALVRITRGRDRTTVADVPEDAVLAASSDGERIAIAHGDRVRVFFVPS